MTRLTSISQTAHEFFYGSPRNNYTFGVSCSFNLNVYDQYKGNTSTGVFYSYYTTIGRLVETQNNETYLLASDHNMTTTTSKHINAMCGAFPLGYNAIIYVPFQYGSRMGLYDIHYQFKKKLDYILTKSITRQENRFTIKSFYTNIQKTIKNLNFDYDTEKLLQLEQLVKDCDDVEKIKQLKKENNLKIRQLNKEKREKEKAFLNEIQLKYTYYGLINICYNRNNSLFYEVTTPERDIIKHKLVKQKYKNHIHFSYIWFDEDKVRTSQNIAVEKSDVIRLLKLWQHGKLKHGMTIDRYTVLEVMPDYVKVGCHVIPTENLNALLNIIEEEKKQSKSEAA